MLNNHRITQKVRAGRAEFQRRQAVLRDQVREEPGHLDDGTPVVWEHVDDPDAWGHALRSVNEMPWWSRL